MAEKEGEETSKESAESREKKPKVKEERIRDLDLPDEEQDDVVGGRGDQEPLNLGLAP